MRKNSTCQDEMSRAVNGGIKERNVVALMYSGTKDIAQRLSTSGAGKVNSLHLSSWYK